MKRMLLWCALGMTGLFACKNEIDINAPWIETPVVYGFLDVNSDTQYIRIEKTYQNDVNKSTQQGAQDQDSLYFDTLKVTVSSGSSVYSFYKKDLSKEAGFFASDKYRVYRAAGFKPDPSKSYTLTIYNPRSGKSYHGTTRIVGGAAFTTGNNVNINTSTTTFGNVSFNFGVGDNAVVYDTYIRFTYAEFPVANSADSVLKTIDYLVENGWPVGNTSIYSRNIRGIDFGKGLRQKLTPKAGYARRVSRFDFYAAGGSAALKELIDLSIPSTSIVQKKDEYSNIDNGALGIFSSLAVAKKAVIVKPQSIQYLTDILNGDQSNLNFVYP